MSLPDRSDNTHQPDLSMDSRLPPARSSLLPLAIGCLLASLSPSALAAQVPVEDQARAAAVAPDAEYEHALAPSARAVRLAAPISVDGVLDESSWSDATPITEFIQTLPLEGQPASERTEVRIAYDDDAIYVAATLDDRSPLTTRLARRDAGLGDSDSFTVLIDSYHDHETAYRFWTNPSGVMGDAIMTGNSAGGGDSSWDPVWDVCQSLEVPVHFHGSCGVMAGRSTRFWNGYSPRQAHSAMTSTSATTPAQIIPHLIFAGITERFPHLKFVFAELWICVKKTTLFLHFVL